MNSSRRWFLQVSLSAPLAASLGRPALCAYSLSRPSGLAPALQGQGQFQNPQVIRYDGQCFTINGQDTIVHSGCFHYPRCPRDLWRDRLMKFKQAGFNTIETYVFWNYHEAVEGHADLSEFEDFVQLVHSMGFWMIVRPGPYVCAEWDAGGFPHWIIALQFPLRSADPESIHTSQRWYGHVLPVIQRNMITTGGPVIMIQIENEYDYWLLAEAEKMKYITALAQMVWNAGIDIPVITNWCQQAREKSNPVMDRITDTADFYPRWNIVRETLPALAKLRQQQPGSPLGVTELQGGWFSQNGGKLSVDQPGVDAEQLDVLTKTMLEQGVTFYSYYMGFGGTNFDWAAKNLTTTYDYAAPVREPGGLWDKYYAARGVCIFNNQFGPLLARAHVFPGPQSTNSNVSVTERANGKSGFLFVRENGNSEQQFKMTFPDPNSPSRRTISVPRQGQLILGARQMKMLPVQTPLPGAHLRYTTAEVLGYGLNVDRTFLIMYDEPGRAVELAIATEQMPHVEGDTLYQYWDQDYESIVIGVQLNEPETLLLVNGLMIVLVPRETALRTWTVKFPPVALPLTEPTDTVQVPYMTDCALLGESGAHRQHAWAELYYKPGAHHLTALWPWQPDQCLVDGNRAPLTYDQHWRTTKTRFTVPALPAQPINLTAVETWTEKLNPQSGTWVTSPARPLEELGEIPYGYVKYSAQFQAPAGAKLAITTFDDDGKHVFVDGQHVREAANPQRQTEFPLDLYSQRGANTLDIVYELFGSYNFGPNIARLKGIESATVELNGGGKSRVNSWSIQLTPPAMRGREIDPDFSAGEWQPATLGGATSSDEWLPAFCWTRAHFTLDSPTDGWEIAWNATIEADRDALVYLNGRFVGRYVTQGPQKQFYLPEPWIKWGTDESNVLTVVLAYTGEPQHLKTLRIAPYAEFAVKRTTVEFRWR
jgi:hypothetical protein